MKNILSHHLLRTLLILALAVGLAGCGDDKNPTGGGGGGGGGGGDGDLVGTWVAYQGLENGQPEPDGGTYGACGTIAVFNADGTGTMTEVDDPDHVGNYTWSAADGVLSIVDEDYGPTSVTYVQSGDMFSYTVPEGEGTYSEVYQRYRGASVLTGSWRYLSSFDDFMGMDLQDDPHTLAFDGNGTATVTYDGDDPDTLPYATDTAWLTFGGGAANPCVYTVVGTTLHLFQYYSVGIPGGGEEDVMEIRKYQRQ